MQEVDKRDPIKYITDTMSQDEYKELARLAQLRSQPRVFARFHGRLGTGREAARMINNRRLARKILL